MKSILPAGTSEFLITQKCNLNCTYCFEKCKSKKNIDWKKFVEIMDFKNFMNPPTSNIYIFGGEPLLNTSFIERFFNYIDKNENIGNSLKQKLLSSIVSSITTNGTLIEAVFPFLKKYNCTLQVSIDGPEDINDKNRVDHQGNGHFKQIMHNLELCRKNRISYVLHGAVSRNNYSNFCRICKFFLEQELLKEKAGIQDDISVIFYRNFLQIVFEDDITDNDIDILIDQFDKTLNMIMTDPILEGYDRKEIAEGFLNRRGALCSAGVYMYSYDDSFNIFPCHRLNTAEENIKANRLTSLVDDSVSWNYDLYLQFQEVFRRGEMYGAVLDNNKFEASNSFWLNWCPSTNWETSGSVFCIPSKYDVLTKELQRLMPLLAEKYRLNITNPKFYPN